MKYLLINHVPFGATAEPGVYTLGDLWLEDLRAQVRAMRGLGRVTVATPLVDRLEGSRSGSFHLATVRPEDEGFDYIPLPAYRNFREWLLSWASLRRTLKSAIAGADVVQADYGGHPVPLGQIAWRLASEKKRIWVFDGADPIPRMERHTAQEPRLLHRLVKRALTRRFAAFCHSAVREADLVFAHNQAVQDRFAESWNSRCHVFARTFVRPEDLLPASGLRRRMERWLDPGRALHLVACGRQIALKGTDHVIQAMELARRRGVNVDLTVIGDGEALESYRALAQGLKLAGSVRFIGTVPYGAALFQELAACDVMVITNLTAEISRNVFLAMARGLPLLMYRNPATDNLVESSRAGYLVPAGDVESLAGALIHLHERRTLLSDLAGGGLATAAENTLENCHRRRAALVSACAGEAPWPAVPKLAS